MTFSFFFFNLLELTISTGQLIVYRHHSITTIITIVEQAVNIQLQTHLEVLEVLVGLKVNSEVYLVLPQVPNQFVLHHLEMGTTRVGIVSVQVLWKVNRQMTHAQVDDIVHVVNVYLIMKVKCHVVPVAQLDRIENIDDIDLEIEVVNQRVGIIIIIARSMVIRSRS